jgi:anti-sigma regulatory factor (Ser/Thr protein kinase)
MTASAAFPVTESSQVAAARRGATWLAGRLDFDEERVGRVALIVSELATNLVKHARAGEILLRPLSSAAGVREGLEIVAIDTGPGIPDVARSRLDGFSTSGSLGHGLGAIERQADTFDLYSQPSGTSIVAAVYRDAHRPFAHSDGRYEVGAVHVAKAGEDVCGDDWAWRMRSNRLAILVADGLGHGLHAHEAATAATDVFAKYHENAPARVFADVHAALRASRGAAVAMIELDFEGGTARYAGLGNISATIVAPVGRQHHLVSQNGTAGHNAGRIHEFNYAVPAGSVIVMASDGLGTHWSLAQYPGLHHKSASSIAAILYRDFSRRRDDVTVVVAKERRRPAEKL